MPRDGRRLGGREDGEPYGRSASSDQRKRGRGAVLNLKTA